MVIRSSKKTVLTAAVVSGLLMGGTSLMAQTGMAGSGGFDVAKNGCGGKDGCGKKGDKDSCEGKDGCKGKEKGDKDACGGKDGCGSKN